MLEKTGIPSKAQVESIFPDDTRLSKGPVAIIECFELIPCNPCATSCPHSAIAPFTDINDIPVIDNDKCNGCGVCIVKCPGLAIMVVDATWSDSRALIRLPYEFLPLPEKGEIIYALDRSGEVIADAEVIRVSAGTTPIVSIAVDKSLVKVVRNIRIKQDAGPISSRSKRLLQAQGGVICRCSDISVAELRGYIAQGFTTVDEIKRFTRLGMGPCQGRTCIPLVMRELAQALDKHVDDISPGTHRPVVTSIKLGDLADYE